MDLQRKNSLSHFFFMDIAIFMDSAIDYNG